MRKNSFEIYLGVVSCNSAKFMLFTDSELLIDLQKHSRLKGLLRLGGFGGFLSQELTKNFASMHNTQSEQNSNKNMHY